MSTDITPSRKEEGVQRLPTRHCPTRSSAEGRCSLLQVPGRSSSSEGEQSLGVAPDDLRPRHRSQDQRGPNQHLVCTILYDEE